jgi:glutaredoxin
MQAQVLGLSVDSVPCLKAWAENLGGINFPLLSDFYPHGQVAESFGVFRSEGYSERAIFVIDRWGIIRYIDIHDIDQQPDNEVLFRVLESLAPGVASRSLEDANPHPEILRKNPEPEQSILQPREAARFVLNCTPWCPDCKNARTFLKQHNIPYIEVDISRDRAAAQRVRGWAKGYETTPTFDIQGTIVVSFDQDKLSKALGL